MFYTGLSVHRGGTSLAGPVRGGGDSAESVFVSVSVSILFKQTIIQYVYS